MDHKERLQHVVKMHEIVKGEYEAEKRACFIMVCAEDECSFALDGDVEEFEKFLCKSLARLYANFSKDVRAAMWKATEFSGKLMENTVGYWDVDVGDGEKCSACAHADDVPAEACDDCKWNPANGNDRFEAAEQEEN